MRRNLWIIFGIIIIITVLAGMVDWPTGPNLKMGKYFKEFKIHEGLDLQGGVHLVYELDTSKVEDKDKTKAAESVINVIDRRINALGVTEPVIQSAKIGGKEAVVVELPGVTDVNEAINLIGKTAQLKFLESNDQATVEADAWKESGLDGSHLRQAEVQFDQSTGEPQVSLQFDSEGTKLFSEITARNLQKPVAISLDNEIISAPTVQSAIDDGQAVISGKFTIDEAKKLSIELNAGALPVPISLVEQRTIGPTLGSESVQKSLVAGLIGIFFVALFMIIYYKVPGLLATFALIIYTWRLTPIF
ncbi:MAG: Preprotein translocase subunit SecD [Berkelbacteria bacterium GW2011_GWB1_38_5]|uniref:Preprotein translocase subunit SecD n=1 Tax=Berkelbacteria bacterium GW2011_GWB1_38_5 TaxID=1618336 RepID=A0A0G0K1Q6_9BACT|nr:MAG: Preprotein translocase subunit SecD [Berkelbacteria bacterium GW2011_GWB1_38_5]